MDMPSDDMRAQFERFIVSLLMQRMSRLRDRRHATERNPHSTDRFLFFGMELLSDPPSSAVPSSRHRRSHDASEDAIDASDRSR